MKRQPVKNKIAAHRERHGTRGISRAQLAYRLEIDRAAVTRWEQGKIIPSLSMALKMAELFNCSVEELFQLSPDQKPSHQ